MAYQIMRAAIGGAAILASAAAGAQQPPPVTEAMLAQIDALPVREMCSTQGVGGIAFGSTDLPPSSFNIPGMEKRDAPADARPFDTLALDSTKWSNRFYRATFEMPTRAAEAPRVIERIAAQFHGNGWIEKKGSTPGGGTLLDPDPAPGDVHFYSADSAMAGASRSGARLVLGYLLGAVQFECTDMGLLSLHAREALGDLPAGIPRPLPPAAPRPASLRPEICTTAEGRAEIYELVGSRKPNGLLRYAGERNNYGDRLVAWKTDRLKKSGKVSEQRIFQLMLRGLEAGSPKGNPLAGFGALGTMFDQLEKAAKSADAGDAEGECRGIVGMLRSLEAIDRISGSQWRAMDAALDAEAKRVGLSWD